MKSIITVILTCTLASAIFAQQNKFNIGIEGGPGLINLRGNTMGDFHHQNIGYSGGLTFQYNFPKVLALRTSLSFERKGAQTSDFLITDDAGNSLGVTKFNFYFDYLTVPLLMRATFGKKVHFFVDAGAFFGYLTKVRFIAKESFGRPKIPSGNNASNYQTSDAGLALGLGFAVPIKNKLLLSLELKNNTGLYNIYKSVNNSHPMLKTSSTNLLIGIAYKFGIRG